MKSVTILRPVVLPIVCVLITFVLITVAALAFALLAPGSKLSVAAPIIASQPANPTATS
jgi:hypothetical protein